MALKSIHTSLDEIAEPFRELYTEKDGKFELTGIHGVKTQADIDRLTASLTNEREEHKKTKSAFDVWGDLKHEDVMAKLDRIPELEAAAGDKLDESAIEEIVNKRVSGTINSQTAPLERSLKQAQDALTEKDALIQQLQGNETRRTVHDSLRSAMTEAKIIPEAYDDVLMLAERVFNVREDDGAVVTKDEVGATPGIDAAMWLQEMADKRPHWWPVSQGGGGRGSTSQGGGFAGNPWSKEHWNMTKQGQVVQAQGMEKANQMAAAAGSKVGAAHPAK
jgi:hypothetical protein